MLIHNQAELQAMAAGLGGAYDLANDIDCSGADWIPVGTIAAPFTGNLDGHGFKITGLHFILPSPGVGVLNLAGGLFGATSTGTIQNLVLENVNFAALFPDHAVTVYLGALSGYATGQVNDISASGILSFNDSLFKLSTGNFGGLFGVCAPFFPRKVTRCSSTVNIDVTTVISYDGGFAGAIAGQVERSFSAGSVTVHALKDDFAHSAINWVGGFVGNAFLAGAIPSCQDCYSLSNVAVTVPSTNTGGVPGPAGFCCLNDNGSTLQNCYSVGTVTITGETVFGDAPAGFCRYSGIAGSQVLGSYWDAQASGVAFDASGAHSETTANMKLQATFVGWDFAATWLSLAYCNSGYPCLQAVTSGCVVVVIETKKNLAYAFNRREI